MRRTRSDPDRSATSIGPGADPGTCLRCPSARGLTPGRVCKARDRAAEPHRLRTSVRQEPVDLRLELGGILVVAPMAVDLPAASGELVAIGAAPVDDCSVG